jgi:tRNA (guanine-N7-)-methyltransferase
LIATQSTANHLARLSERREKLRVVCADLLEGRGPFVLEVGCGHGHFLTAFAQAHPDQLCVGIDRTADRIKRAERKQNRSGLTNLHFIRAEAQDFIRVLPPKARFSAIYILFPDPWPKRRHHKHRLLESEFLGAIAERAGQGTRLYFRTDHEPYYTEARHAIVTHSAWKLCKSEAWPFELPTVFQQKAASYRSLIAERRSPA